MEKKNSANQELKKSIYDQQKRRSSSNSSKLNDKKLPWWVEFLFVQIGLPDKWLIKILKTKKRANEFYKNDKKKVLIIFLFLFGIGYLQPLIKDSRVKLRCQNEAFNYVLEKTSLNEQNTSTVKMIAINFCNGGDEIKSFYRE